MSTLFDPRNAKHRQSVRRHATRRIAYDRALGLTPCASDERQLAMVKLIDELLPPPRRPRKGTR